MKRDKTEKRREIGEDTRFLPWYFPLAPCPGDGSALGSRHHGVPVLSVLRGQAVDVRGGAAGAYG